MLESSGVALRSRTVPLHPNTPRTRNANAGSTYLISLRRPRPHLKEPVGPLNGGQAARRGSKPTGKFITIRGWGIYRFDDGSHLGSSTDGEEDAPRVEAGVRFASTRRAIGGSPGQSEPPGASSDTPPRTTRSSETRLGCQYRGCYSKCASKLPAKW